MSAVVVPDAMSTPSSAPSSAASPLPVPSTGAASPGPAHPTATTRRPGRVRRRPLGAAVLLVAALSMALTVLGAGPASAHDAFTGSTPANGSTVATTPDSVTLDFEEPPTTIGLTVKVTGPSGDVQRGAATIEGSKVVQALEPGAPAGSYRIAWRVTSDDGHPVSGELTFTSTAANARGATATPLTPGGASATTDASAATPSASPTTSATPVAASPASTTTSGGSSALPIVLVVVIVLLAAAVAALVLRRRRSA